MKVLMYKFSSTYWLAVSEVEFFSNMMETTSCSVAETITPTTEANSDTPGRSTDATPLSSISGPNPLFITIQSGAMNTRPQTIKEPNSMITTTDHPAKSSEASGEAPSGVATVTVVVGIIIAIRIALTCIAVIALALFLRKSTQQKQDYDLSYSTYCRENAQQIQPQSQQAPADLYDQIQLSPSTGQAEVIPKAEAENINSLLSHQPNILPNVDMDNCNMDKKQSNVSTFEQPTNTVVKKKQKTSKLMKGKESGEDQNNADEKKGEGVLICSLTAAKEITNDRIKQGEATPTSLQSTESPEALHTAVKKKPKDDTTDNEEKVPSTSPHTVEELYTAVKKERKDSALGEKDRVPPYTVEELYSAVMKKPKDDSMNSNAEAVPPIPPHTVEELYTAIQKIPKKGVMGDKAPPIPPHTMEDYC